jgi:hypothetical protein
MQKKLKIFKLSVNNVQSRATIVALVPWRNFFYMLTRVKGSKKEFVSKL